MSKRAPMNIDEMPRANDWKRIDEERPKQTWKSAQDRMDPEAGFMISKRVLVTDGCEVTIGQLCEDIWDVERALLGDEIGDLKWWMPLPEPPEEADNA